MEYRVLGKTGLNVPALSFGASSLGSMFRRIDEELARKVQKLFEPILNRNRAFTD